MLTMVGYAEFQSYSNWYAALSMDGKSNITIKDIPSIPIINDQELIENIDQIFSEAEANK